ncbi:MAG: hypothetical protein DRN27_05760 [Thermoplasmata archaeon]|nr:MAG: hypothetical protein DRN27_05760 [Thermoplasmata archaeon]
MEYTQIAQMDEKDNEIVNILIRIGMARNTAKVFVAIKELNNPDTKQIMQFTGIMQPQISVAVRQLIDMGCVESKTEQTENRGRPISYFSLKKSIDEIIDDMEMIVQEKINHEKQNIERLKELTENYIYDE